MRIFFSVPCYLSGVWGLKKWCLFSRCFSLLSLKSPKTTLVVLLRVVLFLKKPGFSSLGLLFLELRAARHSFSKFWSRLDTIMFYFFEVRAQKQRPRSHLSCSNIALNHWHFLRQMFPIKYCSRCSMPARISACFLRFVVNWAVIEWWKFAKFEDRSQGGKQECFWGRLGIDSVNGLSCIVELAIDTLGLVLLFI